MPTGEERRYDHSLLDDVMANPSPDAVGYDGSGRLARDREDEGVDANEEVR